MSRFSQKIGITPLTKAMQIKSLDIETRNRLYNGLLLSYFVYPRGRVYGDYYGDSLDLIWKIWNDFFKNRRNQFSKYHDSWMKLLNDNFWRWEWHYALDFIEFIVQTYKEENTNKQFMEDCNNVFTEESVPYRFVGKEIVPLTNEVEIAEIETALDSPFVPIQEHFGKALEHLSDRANPDYPNSIKESISAVECICQIIVGRRGIVLNRALNQLEESGVEINNVLKRGFRQLYGWTSSDDGIRHAMMDLPSVDQDDARFMLVTCSAFVNYLIAEASKAGINLQSNYETIRGV